MRVVIVTTADDMLGGVFAQAYNAASGVTPHTIFILPDRDNLSFPFWAKGPIALKLLNLTGAFRLAGARFLRYPIHAKDRQVGLHRDWLVTLAAPGTNIVHFASLNDKDAFARLAQIKPDVLISIGAPEIFKGAVIELPRLGAINVHNGRLPKYRGHFGTFWEIYHGEPWAYVCIHKMVPKVDAGSFLAVERINVAQMASFLDLMLEKKRRGGELLARVVRDIEQHDRIPDVGTQAHAETESGYFGWPRVRDIFAFSWKKRAARCG